MSGSEYDRNPRGGAREARNPEFYCTADVPENDDGKCHNYSLLDGKGGRLTVCRSHGGATPGSKAVIARGTIAQVAEKQGIVLPDVKPKDFPKIAAEVISWNLAQFAALGSELEALRLLHSPVDHAREYGDIFSLLDQMGRTIATLTKAAAALPPIPDEPPVAPPREQVMAALEGIRSRMAPGDGGACGVCGCGGACRTVAGVVTASQDDVSDPASPGAVVLPLMADSDSQDPPLL